MIGKRRVNETRRFFVYADFWGAGRLLPQHSSLVESLETAFPLRFVMEIAQPLQWFVYIRQDVRTVSPATF